MMNDLNIPFFRKTMFAGMATLFLSTGVTQANPISDGEEVTEKHAVALPQQKKVTITGVVKDALGPVVGANVVEKGPPTGRLQTWKAVSLCRYLRMPCWSFPISVI